MKPADYKCTECNHIQELWIENKNDFPVYVKCNKCNSKSKRMFSSLYSICHQGKVGNYKNGYTSSPVSIKKT